MYLMVPIGTYKTFLLQFTYKIPKKAYFDAGEFERY